MTLSHLLNWKLQNQVNQRMTKKKKTFTKCQTSVRMASKVLWKLEKPFHLHIQVVNPLDVGRPQRRGLISGLTWWWLPSITLGHVGPGLFVGRAPCCVWPRVTASCAHCSVNSPIILSQRHVWSSKDPGPSITNQAQ